MNQVYIKTEDCSNCIRDYFKGKDLITLEEIISVLEDFIFEENERKEEEKYVEGGFTEYDDFLYTQYVENQDN